MDMCLLSAESSHLATSDHGQCGLGYLADELQWPEEGCNVNE